MINPKKHMVDHKKHMMHPKKRTVDHNKVVARRKSLMIDPKKVVTHHKKLMVDPKKVVTHRKKRFALSAQGLGFGVWRCDAQQCLSLPCTLLGVAFMMHR